jgi:hypothetical protein
MCGAVAKAGGVFVVAKRAVARGRGVGSGLDRGRVHSNLCEPKEAKQEVKGGVRALQPL